MTERKFTHPKDADPGHPGWQLADGSAFRLYAIDGGGYFPIHGAFFDDEEGQWFSGSWSNAGRMHGYSESLTELSLIDKPPRRVQGWVNVYQRWSDGPHSTREKADNEADEVGRIACIYIDVEEGEGLE